MFKLYSKGCQYTLRALALVLSTHGNVRFQAHEVCEALDIPEYFTRKIFQSLVQSGFLEAHSGPGGGYSLTRPPEAISLLEIIHAVDGADTFANCVLGLSECSGDFPCPLHDLWLASKLGLLRNLATTTLADFVDITRAR